MNTQTSRCKGLKLIAVAIVFPLLMATTAATAVASQTDAPARLLVLAKSAADYAILRSDVAAAGGNVVGELPELNLLVVIAPDRSTVRMIAGSPYSAGIARDRIRQLTQGKAQPELGRALAGVIGSARDGAMLGPNAIIGLSVITGDPAFNLAGLMWDVERIRAPKVWNLPNGLGYSSIKVGVIDTGLDYTHAELAHKVDQVVDFTVNEQPNICQSSFGLPTDAQLATAFGAPAANLDFNGHGTWIGGAIAAALDGQGINGIAPNVQLVALKVAQNCGSSYDSEILDALIYAANNSLDVVNISLSKYLDRTDPEQNLIYTLYQSAVAYAVARGTIVVAPAGDDHTRIGAGGQVLRHGVLSVPPGGVDRFGQWEVPGGIPHVVDVGATVNVVNSASATCPGDSLAAGSHQWCKPTSDSHQPFGVGLQNQLAYYSNYGPRITLVAPGGARKFNLPDPDRGGTEGWPWTGTNSVEGGTSTADGFNVWQVFGITSDFSTEIPCFTFSSFAGFPNNQCYAVQQGTSMSAAHVAAVAALILATHPAIWKTSNVVANVVLRLKSGTTVLTANATPPVSRTDTSAMDRTGALCSNGSCHLGGAAISNLEAYGAGLVNAKRCVSAP